MDSSSAIPAFITKLWEMVNDKKYDNLIHWRKDGRSFIIRDPTKFCSELLPIYYKHNNMSSFIRQLNKYGFKKVVALDSASLKNDKNDLEFYHQHFIKDYPQLLSAIKRKISANTREVTYPNVMVQIAKEVQQLQQKQSLFESKLRAMKNENTALWREHSILRHKHQNLQKLLNKLIQFLLTLVQQTRGLNIKRINLPLMIKDRSQFSSDGLAAIKDNSLNKKTDSKQVELNLEDAELIVPEIEDDSLLAEAKSDCPNYSNSTTTNTVPNYNITVESPSSLIAVPLQEVSPAIVYGKHVEIPKPVEAKSILSDKVKNRKRIFNKAIVSSSNKVNPKSNSLSNPTAVKRARSVVPIYVKKQTLQPLSQSDSLKDGIQISEIKPTSVPKNSGLPLISSSPLGQIKENDTKENSVTSSQNLKMEEIDAIPVILSPSGTQLSPADPGNDKDKEENNSVSNDHPFGPLQNDIDNHIGAIQSDLDVLKDLLQGEGISIDASTLLGLMNEDPLSLNFPEAMGLPSDASSNGNELISYSTPSLLDIVESIEEGENPEYIDTIPSSTLNTPRPEYSFDLPSPSLLKTSKK